MGSPILDYNAGAGSPTVLPLPTSQFIDLGTGITHLVIGQSYVDVGFSTILADALWEFGDCRVVNTVDGSSALNIWPGIVTSKTTSGFRLQLNGMPDSNNYYLHWTVNRASLAPPAPATTYFLSGPTSGAISTPSASFSVALPGSATLATPLTIIPSDGGAGGTFSPSTIMLTTGAPSGAFTYTTSTYGSRSITTTNDGGLTDPVNLNYTSVASTYTLTGPSSGGITPSTNFTVALPAGGWVIGSVTVTPNDSSGGGSFTPTTVNLTTGAPSATFTYTPVSIGAKTIATTNTGGLTNPGSLTYTVVDTGHLLNTLSAYWKLDEASGTRMDSTASGINLAPNGGPVGAAGKINNGCQFNAAAQYLNVGDTRLQVTSDFTFSLWAKINTQVANMTLVSKDSNVAGSRDYSISYANATAGYFFSVTDPTTIAVAVGSLVSNGVWTHIVAWWDSADSKLRIRINDATTYVSSMTGALTQSAAAFRVGAYGSPETGFFDGIVDEVGFWKRKLTATEITALYNSGAGLPYSSFTT